MTAAMECDGITVEITVVSVSQPADLLCAVQVERLILKKCEGMTAHIVNELVIPPGYNVAASIEDRFHAHNT